MMEDLPDGAYFATHYLDRRGNVETRRVYYDDGRVEAFDGREWWRVCDFLPEQIQRAKDAIRTSGLLSADDMTAEGVNDAAMLKYSWSLDGERGSVTNYAYPARKHPAFQKLDEHLDAFVDEAEKPEDEER